MTNAEYKEFARNAVNEIDTYNDELESNAHKTFITNIGEVFLVKIKEGLAKLDQNTFPHRGADKLNKTFLSIMKKDGDDVEECFGGLPVSQRSEIILDYYIYTGVRLALKNHSDPEYMLWSLGIEDPQQFISFVRDIENTDNRDEFIFNISRLHDGLYIILGWEKLFSFSIWGMVSSFGRNIISFCKENSTQGLIHSLKIVKHVGEKYYSTYKERVIIIQSQLRAWFNGEIQNFEDIIPQNIIDMFIGNLNSMKDSSGFYKKICREEYEDELSCWYMDILFMLYYYIYERPQYVVNLGYDLMSEKVSNNICSAIFTSFKEPDYAGLIQFEYEWWCRNSGRRLSLPFPFFEGNINLENISVIDYDLNNDKKLKIIPTDNNLQYATDKSPILPIENILSNIDNQLVPYYTIFNNNVKHEAGSYFRKHYLHEVVKYSDSINDSYSLHGFAYILFKSQYFNWGRIEFDNDFVSNIKKIFNIKISSYKPYNESKSKDKAWKILQDESNSIPTSLLSDEELKRISPTKSSTK